MYTDYQTLFLILWGLLAGAGIVRALLTLRREDAGQRKWLKCLNSASIGLIGVGVLIHSLMFTRDILGWAVFALGVFLGIIGLILATPRGYTIISTRIVDVVRRFESE